MPAVLSIFQDKPEHGHRQDATPNVLESPASSKTKHGGKGKGKVVETGTAFDMMGKSERRRSDEPNAEANMKRKRKPVKINAPPPIIIHGSDSSIKSKKSKQKAIPADVQQQQGKEYQQKGAAVSLEPILENKTLRIPRQNKHRGTNSDKTGYDPDDPLISWYFPRRSPDYWEMLDDVSKMFSDLQMQQVTLKHFQRPIDYVTVLLCLSNVVFAEMFSTLQEKVTESQYRIEFVVNGRTGVNLYLSAYSREHIYMAKSLMHKVNVQLDLAKKHSPRSTIQYIHLIECVERYLVHDRRKSWGRIGDGHYTTWTDMDSPTVVHEIGIAESRPELYRRCKRYIQDVPSVNLVVAVKIDSTECEWAELLVLARNPHDNKMCKIFNWVRFWGEGAVNRGELRYYPSDFLEVEDRWKIPKAHMRPLDAIDGPR